MELLLYNLQRLQFSATFAFNYTQCENSLFSLKHKEYILFMYSSTYTFWVSYYYFGLCILPTHTYAYVQIDSYDVNV